MSELPIGWVSATLSDICGRIMDGSHIPPKPAASGLPMLSAKNIQKRQLIFDDYRLISEKDFEREHARTNIGEGDVLLTIVGAIGRTAVVPADTKPFTLQRSVAVLKPKLTDSRFVSYALEAPSLQKYLSDNAKGTAQKGIYLQALAQVEIPLAPLNEQERIADKLDSLLARADSCQSHLERVPQIIKRFRQSVLAKAISGELTEDWRESETTEDWNFERAEDVCDKVQSGGTPREGFIDKAGTPFLKVYNIVDQKVDFHYRPQYITNEIHKGSMSKSQTKPGDVLMNIVGPPLGKVAIVPDEFPEWNINQAITLFRPNERITSKWIYYFLCSGYSIAEIVHETRGSAGQSNISLSQCRDFVFPVPPMEEQAEIVRRVEKLFDYADQLEAHYLSASERVEQLTPSLLAKAFRGELVEQDPNDEPAENLLERIRAAREADKANLSGKKSSRKIDRTVKEVGMLKLSEIKPDHLSSILKERGSLTAEALWSASQLEIDDFYDQLKKEEAKGYLREIHPSDPDAPRLLEVL